MPDNWDERAWVLLRAVAADLTALEATLQVARIRDAEDPVLADASKVLRRVLTHQLQLLEILKG